MVLHVSAFFEYVGADSEEFYRISNSSLFFHCKFVNPVGSLVIVHTSWNESRFGVCPTLSFKIAYIE